MTKPEDKAHWSGCVAEPGPRAGDVVMTGACGGILPIAPGDEARADFGALGKV